MDQQRHLLEKLLTDVLKPAGFKKKANGWYRNTDETITVLLLQKSSYGNQYYFNVGAVVKKLDHVPFPKEQQCHLRTRLSNLLKSPKILEPLDLEDKTVSFEQKLQEMAAAIQQEAIPILLSWGSLEGIRKIREYPSFKRFMMVPSLREALEQK